MSSELSAAMKKEGIGYTFPTSELNLNTLEMLKPFPTLLFRMAQAASVQWYISRRLPCTS